MPSPTPYYMPSYDPDAPHKSQARQWGELFGEMGRGGNALLDAINSRIDYANQEFTSGLHNTAPLDGVTGQASGSIKANLPRQDIEPFVSGGASATPQEKPYNEFSTSNPWLNPGETLIEANPVFSGVLDPSFDNAAYMALDPIQKKRIRDEMMFDPEFARRYYSTHAADPNQQMAMGQQQQMADLVNQFQNAIGNASPEQIQSIQQSSVGQNDLVGLMLALRMLGAGNS